MRKVRDTLNKCIQWLDQLLAKGGNLRGEQRMRILLVHDQLRTLVQLIDAARYEEAKVLVRRIASNMALHMLWEKVLRPLFDR